MCFGSGLGFLRERVRDSCRQEVVIAKQERALIANFRRDQRSCECEARFRLIELADLVSSCVGTDGVQRIDDRDHASGGGEQRNGDASVSERLHGLR